MSKFIEAIRDGSLFKCQGGGEGGGSKSSIRYPNFG